MDKSPGKGAIPVINLSIARCPRTLEKGTGLHSAQLCGHVVKGLSESVIGPSTPSRLAIGPTSLSVVSEPDLAEVYPERRHAQESRLCWSQVVATLGCHLL